MSEIDEKEIAAKAQAEKLLATIFSELVPLCMEFGITMKRAAELLTFAQVQALEELGVTRIDMVPITGFSPKTVRRVLHDGPSKDETDLVLRVIGDWQADPEFPAKLAINGEWPSFAHLRDKYGKDLTLAALSNALVRRGLAKKEGDTIELISGSLVTTKGEDLIPVATDAIKDLISTISNNVLGNPPLMQRRLYSYRVERENIPKLREALRPPINELREKVHLILRAHETTDANVSDVELGIGVFEFMHDPRFKIKKGTDPIDENPEN